MNEIKNRERNKLKLMNEKKVCATGDRRRTALYRTHIFIIVMSHRDE